MALVKITSQLWKHRVDKMFGSKLHVTVLLFIALASSEAKYHKEQTEYENSVFRIMPGIELVGKSGNLNVANRNFQSNSGANMIFNQVVDYLGSHDVKLRFNNFMNSSDINKIYKQVVQTFSSDDLAGK